MSTEISTENERYLQRLVERGVYRDRAQAIDEAVELLRRRDQLREDIRSGIDQVDRGELLDAEDVFRRLEERAQQIEAQRAPSNEPPGTHAAGASRSQRSRLHCRASTADRGGCGSQDTRKCELLASQPQIGQRRPEFAGDYRSFPVERWVIFYRILGDHVEVHRVLDGARDLDSLIG